MGHLNIHSSPSSHYESNGLVFPHLQRPRRLLRSSSFFSIRTTDAASESTVFSCEGLDDNFPCKIGLIGCMGSCLCATGR
mmetsp:Transcript_25939/g.41082  ORF Transcript_25939/g.41082 Transcript_25939/m.41082 type:complete len:80 (-) Transcript_25939:1410-1649(-)